MKTLLISAMRASLITFMLCGLIYPLALTGLGKLLFPMQANGSLVRNADGTVVGSRFIGQQWIGREWFHGRPSATTSADPNDPGKTMPAPYNAASSNGSNLGPTSKRLAERLLIDRKTLEAAEPELMGRILPADMLTTSASGLDPEISVANAHLQAIRVAHARGLPVAVVRALVDKHVTSRILGVFGEPRVNVLDLNLALRQISSPLIKSN